MKTIGIKLADGTFYPVLEEGTPKKRMLDLTTAKDNQTKVQIDLYRSEDGNMEDAEYVDTLEVTKLNPHPNGEPELHLSVGLDEDNNLTAEVVDPETGKKSETEVKLVSRTEAERAAPADFALADSESDETTFSPDELPDFNTTALEDMPFSFDNPPASPAAESEDTLGSDNIEGSLPDLTDLDNDLPIEDTTLESVDFSNSEVTPAEESPAEGSPAADETVLSDSTEDSADAFSTTDFTLPDIETDDTTALDSDNLTADLPEVQDNLDSDLTDELPDLVDFSEVQDTSSPADDTTEALTENPLASDDTTEAFAENPLASDDDTTEAFAENPLASDDTTESFDTTSLPDLDTDTFDTTAVSDSTDDFSSDLPDFSDTALTSDDNPLLSDETVSSDTTEVADKTLPDFDDAFNADIPEGSNFTSDIDTEPESFALPDFDAPVINNDLSNESSSASGLSFDDLDDPDFSTPDFTTGVPSGSAMDFSDLYDKETIAGEHASLYNDEEEEKKTRNPVVICIICAIICVIATILLLFVVPSKYNLLASRNTNGVSLISRLFNKDETRIERAADKEPEEVREESKYIDIVVEEPKEDEAPEAVEDKIVIAPEPEKVVPKPKPAPVEEVKPKAKKTSDVKYHIKWGDTLWDISESYYKTPWKYPKIADYNKIKNPDFIISGSDILIPAE